MCCSFKINSSLCYCILFQPHSKLVVIQTFRRSKGHSSNRLQIFLFRHLLLECCCYVLLLETHIHLELYIFYFQFHIYLCRILLQTYIFKIFQRQLVKLSSARVQFFKDSSKLPLWQFASHSVQRFFQFRTIQKSIFICINLQRGF